MHTFQELPIEELSEVIGGTSAQAPQTKQGQAFEIKDYSFDIEQVLNIGSR
jgi:bacteriocin-like protein